MHLAVVQDDESRVTGEVGPHEVVARGVAELIDDEVVARAVVLPGEVVSAEDSHPDRRPAFARHPAGFGRATDACPTEISDRRDACPTEIPAVSDRRDACPTGLSDTPDACPTGLGEHVDVVPRGKQRQQLRAVGGDARTDGRQRGEPRETRHASNCKPARVLKLALVDLVPLVRYDCRVSVPGNLHPVDGPFAVFEKLFTCRAGFPFSC